MILSITVKEITFWNENLIYVIRNVSFTFDFKKLLENALIFVTDVVLNILQTYGFSSKLFSQMISLSIILCLFFHNSGSKYSHKTTSCTSNTSVRKRRIIAFNFDFRVHLFVQLSIFLS